MASLQISVDQIIQADAATVFETLIDPNQLLEWMPDLKEVEIITKTDELVGSSTKLTLVRAGKRMVFVQTVCAIKENELLEVELKHKDMEISAQYRLNAQDGVSTLLHFEEQILLRSSMLKFAKRLVKSMEVEAQKKALRQLADYIESHHAL